MSECVSGLNRNPHCSGRGPRTRSPPRPRRRRLLKKAGGRRRRGGGRPPRRPRRGVLHRRAPPRPEAGAALGVGPQGRAPDSPRPPPLPVALRDGLRGPGYGRDGVVPDRHRVQAAVRRPARRLRPRGRGRPPEARRAAARQCRLAHPAQPRRAGRPQAGLPAAPSAPNCTLRSLPQPASQVVGPSLLRPPRRSGRWWTNPSSTPSSPTWTSSSTLTERCSNLSTRQPEISSRTNFAWWPKNQAPL